jgi:hypothetical protein
MAAGTGAAGVRLSGGVDDEDRLERDTKVGDWVWLRVRHRTLLSLPTVTSGKLRPRYYGPYQVAEVVNVVIIRL